MTTVTFAAGQVSDNSSISGKTIIPSDSSQHYHRFTYALSDDGTTITATCDGAGTCGLTSNPTLTIAAPTSLTYDGTAKAATITGDTAVLGTPSIVYTKNGAAFTGTPTEPGVYTASITLGTATASVTYEIQSVKYNITISNANTGCTVTPDKTQAAFGETVTLTISPAPGYELDTLTAAKTDDSTTTVAVSGTGNTRTFTMPAYPVTVSATFSQIDYTITKATMTNGGVTVKVGGTEAASAHYGDTVTLIPAPATDCALSSLTVCKTGDESTTVSVANNQFTMPAYPVTVSATFSLISITGIGLSSSTITMTYGDAATSLAATVSPETALNTKVKFSVSSGADKIKLYKDASCTQEIGASDEFSSGTSIYVKPLASGTATITAVSVGDATKTASCDVTINKATSILPGELSYTATYGDTMAAVKNWLDNQSPLGVDGAELSGSWAWVDTTVQDSDPVGNVGNHSYQARFTPTDSNYNSITKTVEVIVDPKSLSPDDVDVSADEFTYNGTQQAPTVNVTDTAATLTGNDYTISYKKKTDENTWEVVSGTTNAGAWSQKAKIGNLKKFVDAFHFLKENQIFTVEELERQTHELSAAVDALVAQSKANTARIKQLDNMITFAEHIRRIQPVIDEMNGIHWKGRREKFRADHQDEIDLYYTSQRILKEKHDVKKIDIPGWKKEQATLRQEEAVRATQYDPLREKLNQMLNVKYCIEEAKHEERKKQQSRKKNQPQLE